MPGQVRNRQPKPRSALLRLTALTTFGRIVGFGLVGAIGAGTLAFVACECAISAFPIGGDDWAVVPPWMLALLGLIDGALCGYRRSGRRTKAAERALSGIKATQRPFGDLLCSKSGYAVWAIVGLVAGGWIGVFRYGSFWGLLMGPAITMGIRFVLLWLWGRLPSVVRLATTLRTRAIWLDALAGLHAGAGLWLLLWYFWDKGPGVPRSLPFFACATAVIAYGLWFRRRWIRTGATLAYGIPVLGLPVLILLIMLRAKGEAAGFAGIIAFYIARYWAGVTPIAVLMLWFLYGRRGRQVLGEINTVRFGLTEVSVLLLLCGVILGGIAQAFWVL